MTINVLLTGGRAPATLDLARLFDRAGHRVIVADSLPRQLCSWSRAVTQNIQVPAPRHNLSGYLDALANIVQTEQIDWLIPTCEEIFYIAFGLSRLSPFCRVFAEPLEVLEPLHNKWTFIQMIKAMGLAAPQTIKITSPAELEIGLTQSDPTSKTTSGITTTHKVVLKPIYSRFASQVHRLSLPVESLPDIWVSEAYPWVIQALIEGQQYCLYGVAHRGRLTAYAAYPMSFTADAGSCIYYQSATQPSLRVWMQTVVNALGFTGQIAFDVIVDQAGTIYPLECNPRAISAIHLFRPEQGLDRAFFQPDDLPSDNIPSLIEPLSEQRRMLGLAMVIYGLPKALKQGQAGSWWHHFWAAKDVLLWAEDPAPFFGVGRLLWDFWQVSRQTGQTLQQVSTRDIEWDGEEMNSEFGIPKK